MPFELDIGAVFELVPHPIMVVDRSFRCVAANAAFRRATGRTASSLLGTDIFAAFPNNPRNAAIVRASLEKVCATREVDEIAAVASTIGERVWSARHSPILGGDGEVELIIQEATEITVEQVGSSTSAEMIGRAMSVQLELQDLRDMFSQAPGFMCFVRGPDHVFEIVNDAYMQLVGHRQVIGMSVRDALPELVAQGFVDLLDNVYRSGQAFAGKDIEVQLQRARGASPETSFVEFIYQPISDRNGAVIGIFVQGQDITSRHHLAEGRRLEERRRRFLIEAMPVQVWTADADGKLDFVSERVVSYFQRSAEKILGDGWLAVLHPDDVAPVVQRWTHSLRTGEAYEVEFRLHRGDGEHRWHLGRANAERDEQGAIQRWVGTNTDIHEAKMSLAELTARSQYEQRLIGIVTHDLRNPLSAIALGVEVLEQQPIDPAARRVVERISRAAERASRLIKDLLDFAKGRIGASIPVNPTPTNLREIVEQVVDEFEVAAPGRVVRVGHAGVETGRWDADRLAQVVSNLIGNALQHGDPASPVYVESRISGSDAILTVANRGVGITASELPKLFEPYQRGAGAKGRTGSLGLGLFIAREVITAHGGSIEVESRPHAETRFTVRLPRFSPAGEGDA